MHKSVINFDLKKTTVMCATWDHNDNVLYRYSCFLMKIQNNHSTVKNGLMYAELFIATIKIVKHEQNKKDKVLEHRLQLRA